MAFFFLAPVVSILLYALIAGISAPSAETYVLLMFGGLLSAGATGALVRFLLSDPSSRERGPLFSLVMGGLAGLIVGLAYLIPQWIGAPDMLLPKTVLAANKIQFLSVVLVAVTAGIGFETVFQRLQKQANDVPVGLT